MTCDVRTHAHVFNCALFTIVLRHFLTDKALLVLGIPPCHPRTTELCTVAKRYPAGVAQWLERRTLDRKVPGSSPGRSGGRIFFSRVNFLCWPLLRYPFNPRVTAVARKRLRSFCQKCRCQVTAKHTYTLPLWLWMKWHCKLVHGWMVYTELAPIRQHFTWHQPCNNQRALSVHHFHKY